MVTRNSSCWRLRTLTMIPHTMASATSLPCASAVIWRTPDADHSVSRARAASEAIAYAVAPLPTCESANAWPLTSATLTGLAASRARRPERLAKSFEGPFQARARDADELVTEKGTISIGNQVDVEPIAMVTRDLEEDLLVL